MKLLKLAARVSSTFTSNCSQHMSTLLGVKDGQARDVVTELDLKLHRVSEQFVAEQIPHCRLLSEESAHKGFELQELYKGDWLVVDPLDGSNNYVMGLPNYGYMAALLVDGFLEGAAIVLPDHNQYIVLEGGQSLYAQPLPVEVAIKHGAVYYAYPPKQDSSARHARYALLDVIDAESTGMYRYGSSCVGLYQLLCGRHAAFIGHGIRLWDAVAFLPVLSSMQFVVKYNICPQGFSIVASKNAALVARVESILHSYQGMALHSFCQDKLCIDI